MSKVFLGILTAHHPSRAPYRERSRETFLKEWPTNDYKFFFGRLSGTELMPPDDGTWKNVGPAHPEDEIWVDCHDEKEWMVLKNQAMFRYAIDHGYDYCFRVCDDTFVNVENFRKTRLEQYDYAGQMPCKMSVLGAVKVWMKHLDYMHGGCGIWLSRKAMQLLVDDKWAGPNIKDWPDRVEVGFGFTTEMSKIDWDDRWIGEVLKGNLPYNDPRRDHPGEAYAQMGINVFDDNIIFLNDTPDQYVSVHDPGVVKQQDGRFKDLMLQVEART